MFKNKSAGPMFTIENSGDIHLSGNRSQSDELLNAKNVGKVTGENNKAGEECKQPKRFNWVKSIIGAVIAGVIVSLITTYLWS